MLGAFKQNTDRQTDEQKWVEIHTELGGDNWTQVKHMKVVMDGREGRQGEAGKDKIQTALLPKWKYTTDRP